MHGSSRHTSARHERPWRAHLSPHTSAAQQAPRSARATLLLPTGVRRQANRRAYGRCADSAAWAAAMAKLSTAQPAGRLQSVGRISLACAAVRARAFAAAETRRYSPGVMTRQKTRAAIDPE